MSTAVMMGGLHPWSARARRLVPPTWRSLLHRRLTRLRRVTSVDDAGLSAPITGLSHVQLLVSDVGASAKWYSAVLGLAPFADDPDIGYVALRHKAAKFVVVLTKAPAPHGGPAERASEGLDHLALAVPDGTQLADWA